MPGMARLKFFNKLVQGQACLLNDAFQRAGFEWFVLWNHNRAAVFTKNEMGTGLAKWNKTETL
jgi:hypothetical protein